MREIKFRAWNKVDEVMFEVFGFDVNTIYPWQRACDPKIPIAPDAEDCTLMQYTGLKDKNGKEIYEGDIVTCSNGMAYQYKVIFSFGCFEGYDKASGFTRKLCDMNDLKVIGNIYENRELVK